jgi:hypothetical protein
VPELKMAVTIFERQMHQENGQPIKLQLDDESLDAGIEIVKPLTGDPRRREKRIRLLAQDRQVLID